MHANEYTYETLSFVVIARKGMEVYNKLNDKLCSFLAYIFNIV